MIGKTNKNYISGLTVLMVVFLTLQTVSAQFPIKIPKLPKKEQPKQEQPKQDVQEINNNQSPPAAPAENPAPAKSDGKSAGVKLSLASSNPVLMKDTLEIRVHRFQNWKGDSKQWSWVPKTRFSVFHDGSSKQRFTADWYKPDGSLWFSEALRAGEGGGIEQRAVITSERSYELENLALITGGSFSLKITNAKSGEVMFQGKFKVSKLPPNSDEPKSKNQTDFYVEDDWLMPVGYVEYESGENWEAPRPSVWMWFKGNPHVDDFEARLFYNGRQIASTDDDCDGCVRPAKQERRENCPLFPETCQWGLMGFFWKNFITVNQEYDFFKKRIPNTTVTNDAPGEYTVKVFYKNQQVREAKFSIDNKGAIAPNAFSPQIFLPSHKVLIPVKVMGTEKWNTAAWKTDMFYGNPLTGFNVP